METDLSFLLELLEASLAATLDEVAESMAAEQEDEPPQALLERQAVYLVALNELEVSSPYTV